MNEKGTVAIVINTSWNVYNFRLNLLQAIQSQGYKIVIIAPKDEYSNRLIAHGFLFEDLKLNNDSTNTIRELVLLTDLFRIFRKVKPDIILQYTIKPNIYGTLAARFLRIPVVNNISGLGTVFLSNSLSSLIARSLLWLTQRYAKQVFFQNQDDMNVFLRYYFVPQKKARLLPGSGIDVEYFKPVDFKPKYTTFLFIGRLIKDKGIGEYISAVRLVKARFPQVRFQVVGSLYRRNPTATTHKELSSWIKDGLIEYLGHSDDIREVIGKVSCIVLPSYREGLSRALLEAASMSKPIITTDVPGCRDVVDDGENGFLCKVQNPEDLADKMIQMIQLSDNMRQMMGENGRSKVIKQFSEKIVIEKYLNIVKNN